MNFGKDSNGSHFFDKWNLFMVDLKIIATESLPVRSSNAVGDWS